MFGAAALSFTPNEYHQFTLQTSMFKTKEEETYDILGEYWLNEVVTSENMGVGGYREHARNYLDADVKTVSLIGKHYLKAHDLRWGIEWKNESFDDNRREWELRDSVGYSAVTAMRCARRCVIDEIVKLLNARHINQTSDSSVPSDTF